MQAAICAVGSELLQTDRLDTNSLRITELLRRYGVPVVLKCCVGDGEGDIEQALRGLAGVADLIVATGGLGPTADDRTRSAVARLVDRPLLEDPDLVAQIEAKYRRMQRTMPAVNRRQAMRIEGATVLRNDWGTAPGQRVQWQHDGRIVTIFLLPGVPRELLRMMPECLEPWLREHLGEPSGPVRIEARVACVPESAAEERLAPVYDEYGVDAVALLAKPADLRVRLTLPKEARENSPMLQAARAALEAALADTLYSMWIEGTSESTAEGTAEAETPAAQRGADLEEVVGQALRRENRRIAVAESCTGGLLGQRLTAVAGSSAYFVGGALTYSNELKTEMLGVEAEQIERHGAVSEEVVRAMALGAQRRFGTDYALAITGVAGPGGGSEEKPVGTVWLGLATPDGVLAHRHLFPGERERVRWQASQVALDMARRHLDALPPTPSWWPTQGADT